MAIIKKKSWPASFKAVRSQGKNFELRLADFKAKKGDVLLMREWNPKTRKFTGKELRRKIKYVLKFGLNDYGQRKKIEKKGLYVLGL